MSTKSCTSKAKLTAAPDVGDLTAGVPPVPIPNTEVKPRRADCTARESVWESRSLPALIKAIFRDECGLFLLCQNGKLGGGVCHGKWYDGLNREQVKTVIEFAGRSVGKAPV